MFEEIRKVFNKYKGTIYQTEKSIKIVSVNDIFGKKIECNCTVSLLDSDKYPYSVDVNERTYEILGGRGYPCRDINEAVYAVEECLKAFKFEEDMQLRLFDL